LVLTELYVLMVRETTLMLARLDPVGLMDAEFPEDEYDMEAGQLVRRMMREARGPKDVERIASEVFEDCFGPGYGDGLAEFAREVWKRFEEERRDSQLPSSDG
jgi:hypothetical protein